MKIKNIKLNKNVTTFENDTNVELSIDKPNIIYGQNGSGKTTISRIFQYISKYVLDEDKVNTLENLNNWRTSALPNIFSSNSGSNIPFIAASISSTAL